MADVWANSMACHPRATCHIAGCSHRANSMACHPTAAYHIAGCCHLVISLEPHATLHGAVTWRNQFHDRTTLQGVIIPSAILKIVFRHILFFGVFKCSLGFDERRLSYRIRYTCWFRSHSGVCVILVRDFARTTLCHKKRAKFEPDRK